MTEEHMKTCFILGFKLAEHIHGVRRTGDDKKHDEMFEVLSAVANGDLTLMDTPEEIVAKLPTPPAGVKLMVDSPIVQQMVKNGRDNQRVVAEMLVKILPP